MLVGKMTMQLCFQENTDIHYKEGLIGVAMPMKGSGDLYNEVVQEWEDMGETKPLNVSETWMQKKRVSLLENVLNF